MRGGQGCYKTRAYASPPHQALRRGRFARRPQAMDGGADARGEAAPAHRLGRLQLGGGEPSRGNVGLFRTLGNYVSLVRLGGGGRSPAKPVSRRPNSLLTGKRTADSCRSRPPKRDDV